MWQVVSVIEEPPKSLQFASSGTLDQLLASYNYYPGMVTRAAAPRSGCPINAAVEVIGDRWSLLVLRDVMFGNRRHFRALQELSEEGIASNILADRLRRLLDAGLLTRAAVGRGRRGTYSLTEAAIELVPVMAALGAWGLRNRPTTPTLRVRAELLADGGPALWGDFMAELRSEHLGAEAPSHDGPRASERLATAYAEAVASKAGRGLGATPSERS